MSEFLAAAVAHHRGVWRNNNTPTRSGLVHELLSRLLLNLGFGFSDGRRHVILHLRYQFLRKLTCDWNRLKILLEKGVAICVWGSNRRTLSCWHTAFHHDKVSILVWILGSVRCLRWRFVWWRVERMWSQISPVVSLFCLNLILDFRKLNEVFRVCERKQILAVFFDIVQLWFVKRSIWQKLFLSCRC